MWTLSIIAVTNMIKHYCTGFFAFPVHPSSPPDLFLGSLSHVDYWYTRLCSFKYLISGKSRLRVWEQQSEIHKNTIQSNPCSFIHIETLKRIQRKYVWYFLKKFKCQQSSKWTRSFLSQSFHWHVGGESE